MIQIYQSHLPVEILPQRIKKDQFLILSVLEFCISCVIRQYMCLFVCLFLSFLFFIGIWQISNVVLVSGGQQRDSALHVCVSIIP